MCELLISAKALSDKSSKILGILIPPLLLLKANECKLLTQHSHDRTELLRSIRQCKQVAYISEGTAHAMFKLSDCCTTHYEDRRTQESSTNNCRYRITPSSGKGNNV